MENPMTKRIREQSRTPPTRSATRSRRYIHALSPGSRAIQAVAERPLRLRHNLAEGVLQGGSRDEKRQTH